MIYSCPLAVLLFGFDIPLWVLALVGLVAFLFRKEIVAFVSGLLDKLLNKNKEKENDNEKIKQLVVESLRRYGIDASNVKNLDGERLIQILRAFVAFTTVLSQMTPNRVDDVVVFIVGKVVDFLDREKDVANIIANILNRIFPNKDN